MEDPVARKQLAMEGLTQVLRAGEPQLQAWITVMQCPVL